MNNFHFNFFFRSKKNVIETIDNVKSKPSVLSRSGRTENRLMRTRRGLVTRFSRVTKKKKTLPKTKMLRDPGVTQRGKIKIP